MKLDSTSAMATLVGTTIGAGILGIPFVVAQAGVAIGLLHIILIGAAIILLNLYFGEIVLSTKDKHQLAGYVGVYLGTKWRKVATLTMAVAGFSALLAYLIGTGEALGAIFGLDAGLLSIGFWLVMALLLFFGIRVLKESELILVGGVIALAAIIAGIAFFGGHFDSQYLGAVHPAYAAAPFGVVLFAFLGMVAVPEMAEELGRKKKEMKKAIIIGGILPIIIYALFAIAVVGVSDGAVSEVATVQLGELLGGPTNVLLNVFAVLTMTTSFLAIGTALKGMFDYDFGLHHVSAWSLTMMVPLAAFLLGLHSFIGVIGFSGSITGGMQGILVVMMHRAIQKKRKRKPEYRLRHNTLIGACLTVAFVLAMLYELWALL